MLKRYEIVNAGGEVVAEISSLDVRFIEKGIDFQPNLFNGYHAIELGFENPPAVLNLPESMSIRRRD